MRTVLAFLFAPLVPAGVAILLALAPSFTGFSHSGRFIFISLFYCYPIIVFFGIPTYWVFRKMGWLNFWPVVSAGVVAGAVTPLGILSLLIPGKVFENLMHGPEIILYGISMGFLVSFAFWVIAFARSTRHDANLGDHRDAA